MTVFVEVLQKLIQEELYKLKSRLKGQSEGLVTPLFYDPKLSTAQEDLVSDLERTVFALTAPNDELYYQKIYALITAAETGLKAKRSDLNAATGGYTASNMKALAERIRDFYRKLAIPKFNLLDKPVNEDTPEYWIQHYAAYYLGSCIFSASVTDPSTIAGDPSILNELERDIAERLDTLKDRMNSTTDIAEKISRSLRILVDLNRDNQEAIAKLSSINKYFLPTSLANFKVQFDLAKRRIEAIQTRILPTPGALPLTRAASGDGLPPGSGNEAGSGVASSSTPLPTVSTFSIFVAPSPLLNPTPDVVVDAELVI